MQSALVAFRCEGTDRQSHAAGLIGKLPLTGLWLVRGDSLIDNRKRIGGDCGRLVMGIGQGVLPPSGPARQGRLP